jgi:A/G-specific adenine glycosylase
VGEGRYRAGMDLSSALLAWYDRHRRTLPWREDPTPYKVLLSELMLQQTRVDTVIPYFHAFLERWPTLADLAAADEDEVMHAWAGLGYYRRARNLLRAARQAAASGGLSGDPTALRALPGIGPYTAGAIASIAFGTATPVVDGNVERVLARLDGREDDPRTTAGKRAFWARAGELVPEDRPGDFNQALMELGALVCTPRKPACGACPWSEPCVARAEGRQEALPNKPLKKKPRPVWGVSGLLRLEGGWLVARRPPGGLLGGMYEPPSLEIGRDEDPEAAVIRAFEQLSIQVRVVRRLGRVRHVFTHRRLTRTVFEVAPIGAGEPGALEGYDHVAVLTPGAELALSRLARKTLALGQAPPLLA